MGCGALSQSMPSGHVEGGVSTRKPPAGHPLYGRLMRKKSSNVEQVLLRGPNGCGFEKGGSGLWAQRTTNSSTSSSLPSFTRTGSLPSVMPEADDLPMETQGVASCSSIAVSMCSSTSSLPVSVSVPATSKLGSERIHFIGPPAASNTTCVPSSEASLQGSVSPPTSAGSTSDREDVSGWEPPASSTVTRLKSGEADQTPSSRSSRCRSRASPLGALAEPLAPHRSSSSGGAVDLQATALRPSVAEDWWQADLRNGAEERFSLQVSVGQHVVGDRGRKCCPKEESTGRISNDSFDDNQSGDLSASGSVSVPIYAARPTTRKGSETEGSVHSASLVSVISTDTAVETDTLHESAASDSLPENTSRSYFSDFPEDSLLGTEPSEPPDTSSNFAECSTYSEVASIEDDHLSLSFMLERPFAGLETILEEEDDIDDTGLKLPRSCSNTSFQIQARNSSSKRTVCVGPLGDPTAMWWPLSSPEPLSSELLRTSPCAEGIGTLSGH